MSKKLREDIYKLLWDFKNTTKQRGSAKEFTNQIISLICEEIEGIRKKNPYPETVPDHISDIDVKREAFEQACQTILEALGGD